MQHAKTPVPVVLASALLVVYRAVASIINVLTLAHISAAARTPTVPRSLVGKGEEVQDI